MEPENELAIFPVGRVKSDIKEPVLHASEEDLKLTERMDKIRAMHQKVREGVTEIVIFPEWEELLDGIEDFSHILVLYWPHLLDPERRKLKQVHPMGRKDMPIKGIFATRSPARPNPVLVSVVPLVGRAGNVLAVRGLEAVDGSPIIDIKPHVRAYWDTEKPTVPEWMERIHREMEEDHTDKGEGK